MFCLLTLEDIACLYANDMVTFHYYRAGRLSYYCAGLEHIACEKHWAMLYQSFQLLLLRRVGDML